ncbi:ABC transporter substrate-binding protein [Streptomyces sp. TP-A0356]|uniref:ABC transporter substrate-binding protein n=1 Tax=Streptomyces sp. TP-A0356 TaxID=1359208 RepID=UPI0006E1EA73|nr:extracellular solute-binding protein [Streptomyces sp. TP-A0356]
MTAPPARAAAVVGGLACVALGLSACGGTPHAIPQKPSVATSAADVGGMDALIAAAKREGALNGIALPRDWANNGGLIDGFGKKYGIKVTVAIPEGHSQDEIDAMQKGKGRPDAPDVLDMGDTFARSAARQNLLAPYRVAVYDSIPSNQKDPQGRWSNNYGGYVSIGCDANRVRICPRTFADLLKPEYKGKVAVSGDPTRAGSGFADVYAAALANNGSFQDIQPGIDFFAELRRRGNFNPAEATSTGVGTGRTPIGIGWDFLNLGYADRFRSRDINWHVAIPFDGTFAQYYAEAINKDAPHPAAARLWLEYLFSTEGQNLRLAGYARPVLMDAMEHSGTLDRVAAARLPTVEGTPEFPTDAQLEKSQQTVTQHWAKAVRG